MLKTSGENVTPKIFNGSWDQSNANSSHRVSREPHDDTRRANP